MMYTLTSWCVYQKVWALYPVLMVLGSFRVLSPMHDMKFCDRETHLAIMKINFALMKFYLVILKLSCF